MKILENANTGKTGDQSHTNAKPMGNQINSLFLVSSWLLKRILDILIDVIGPII